MQSTGTLYFVGWNVYTPRKKQVQILMGSVCLCVLAFFFSMFYGIDRFEDANLRETVLYSIRLPRLVLVALCGACLSAAGVISQGLFRNPLASPSVLGASSGGVLGAVLVYYFVNPWQHWLFLPLGSFLATLITMFFILMLFKKVCGGDSSKLLICGFAMTTFLGAMSSLLISLILSQVEKASSLMQWMMGGFSGRGWEHFFFAFPSALLGLFCAFSLVRSLDVLAMGEEVASSLNVDLVHLQYMCVLAIAFLVGASVSVAGALPFVGLIVPHITRKLTGSMNRYLLPCSIFNGVFILILGDFVAQKVLYPRELELGTLSSVVGVVFFFALILRRKDAEL